MRPLVGRRPEVAAQDLVATLTVPPHFAGASFANYFPDPNYPSQARARDDVRAFAVEIGRGGARRSLARTVHKAIYLDGGFGVGKTHLLAALAHAVGADAAFGTFVEYTHVVGALGFRAAKEALSAFRVVCIDEFELDDPGDTLIMARLMRELADDGVALAATSNTLPDSLGEGRFAAEDFQREIQGLASAFAVISIDGEDYRHRGEIEFTPASADAAAEVASGPGGVVEDWRALVEDLAHVHPSKMGAYVEGVRVLGLTNVAPLLDQNQALRVVTLVDSLYDRDVHVVAHGAPLSYIFPEEMLRGGYRKKYFRALSRLAAMSHD